MRKPRRFKPRTVEPWMLKRLEWMGVDRDKPLAVWLEWLNAQEEELHAISRPAMHANAVLDSLEFFISGWLTHSYGRTALFPPR